jgi:hypothetical protein
MSWHVQFYYGTEDRTLRYPSEVAAISAACILIDFGADVYGLSTGPGSVSVGREEIAKLYRLLHRKSLSV